MKSLTSNSEHNTTTYKHTQHGRQVQNNLSLWLNKVQRHVFRSSETIVIAKVHCSSVGLLGHSGDSEAMDEQTKSMLDDMHKRKIDMADAILVIDVPS